MIVGGLVVVLIVLAVFVLFTIALRPPRDRREVLPPIPRRALDALPTRDEDGTR